MKGTEQTEKEARQTADTASNEARKLADTARTEAQKLADTAKDVGRQKAEGQLERGKSVVGDQVETVEHALQGAAKRLREDGSPLAGYASDLSDRLSGLSSRIESATLDDLAGDARRLSRQNPGLFMLGAVALGFAASRFLKASERSDRDYASDRFGEDDRGDGYRDAYGGDYASADRSGYSGAYGDVRGDRYGAYASDTGYGSAYRSPVTRPAGPRDDMTPAPRVPMDSTTTDDVMPGSTGVAGTPGKAGASSLPGGTGTSTASGVAPASTSTTDSAKKGA